MVTPLWLDERLIYRPRLRVVSPQAFGIASSKNLGWKVLASSYGDGQTQYGTIRRLFGCQAWCYETQRRESWTFPQPAVRNDRPRICLRGLISPPPQTHTDQVTGWGANLWFPVPYHTGALFSTRPGAPTRGWYVLLTGGTEVNLRCPGRAEAENRYRYRYLRYLTRGWEEYPLPVTSQSCMGCPYVASLWGHVHMHQSSGMYGFFVQTVWKRASCTLVVVSFMAALGSSAGIYSWKPTVARLEFGEELMTRADKRSGDSLRMMMDTKSMLRICVHGNLWNLALYSTKFNIRFVGHSKATRHTLANRLFY